MKFIKVICAHCDKSFQRQIGRVNEAVKFNWNQYCSPECQYTEKSNLIKFQCGNPKCNNTFFRNPSDIPNSKVCYCSKSCSAIVNNPKSAKRRKRIGICPGCGVSFVGRRKYCSKKCYPIKPIIPKEQIIKEICNFYRKKGRIPLKREYYHYKAARFRFGTWNSAVIAAGYNPNPVRFAKKYIAKDGHFCDSLSEKIIDDWLFKRKIVHERNIPYPGNKFHFDFKVNNTYIEFFGLHGELKRYDELVKQKLKIIKKNNIKFLSIFPKNIYSKSNLEKVLKSLIA